MRGVHEPIKRLVGAGKSVRPLPRGKSPTVMRSSSACIYAPDRSARRGVVFQEAARDFIPHTPSTLLSDTRQPPCARAPTKRTLGFWKEHRIVDISPYISSHPDYQTFISMRITGYATCAILLTCIIKVAYSEESQNKMQQQLLDAITPDDTMKMKRPFCNAFTGCGRKRSFYDSATENQNLESSNTIRLPISVYKALLKAATQNLRNAIARNPTDYQLPDVPQVYFSRKQSLE